MCPSALSVFYQKTQMLWGLPQFCCHLFLSWYNLAPFETEMISKCFNSFWITWPVWRVFPCFLLNFFFFTSPNEKREEAGSVEPRITSSGHWINSVSSQVFTHIWEKKTIHLQIFLHDDTQWQKGKSTGVCSGVPVFWQVQLFECPASCPGW